MAKFIEASDFAKPRESVDVILKRLKKSLSIDDSLANYFKERAAIEERYSKELSRLSKKQISDIDQLGTLTVLWDSLLNSASSIAQFHQDFASELLKMESAFKTRTDKDPEWSKLKHGLGALNTNYENEFLKMTKEYVDKMATAEKWDAKAKKRGGVTDKKAEEALSACEAMRDQWESCAKLLFVKFEAMDRQRLEYIKNNVSDFFTRGVFLLQDVTNVYTTAAETCSAFSIDDEIANFCDTKGTANAMNAGGSKSLLDDIKSRRQSVNRSNTHRESISTQKRPANDADEKEERQDSLMVDAEGYTIRPETMPLGFDGDPEDFEVTAGKLKLTIKRDAIRDAEGDALAVMNNLASKLQQSSQINDAPTKRGRRGSIGGKKRTDGRKRISTADNLQIPVPVSLSLNIQEKINILQINGRIDKSLITGEISFSTTQEIKSLPPGSVAKVHLKRTPNLGLVVPNEAYASYDTSDEQQDRFIIDLNRLILETASPIQVFKYQVVTDSPETLCPILITPVWKCEPKQSSLLLNYTLNKTLLQSLGQQQLSIAAAVEGGGEISNVQTKPSGAWDAETRVLIWQYADLVNDNWNGKILARFDSTEPCEPLPITIWFSTTSGILSCIELDVVSDASKDDVQVVVESIAKSVSSGRFGAQVSIIQ